MLGGIQITERHYSLSEDLIVCPCNLLEEVEKSFSCPYGLLISFFFLIVFPYIPGGFQITERHDCLWEDLIVCPCNLLDEVEKSVSCPYGLSIFFVFIVFSSMFASVFEDFWILSCSCFPFYAWRFPGFEFIGPNCP